MSELSKISQSRLSGVISEYKDDSAYFSQAGQVAYQILEEIKEKQEPLSFEVIEQILDLESLANDRIKSYSGIYGKLRYIASIALNVLFHINEPSLWTSSEERISQLANSILSGMQFTAQVSPKKPTERSREDVIEDILSGKISLVINHLEINKEVVERASKEEAPTQKLLYSTCDKMLRETGVPLSILLNLDRHWQLGLLDSFKSKVGDPLAALKEDSLDGCKLNLEGSLHDGWRLSGEFLVPLVSLSKEELPGYKIAFMVNLPGLLQGAFSKGAFLEEIPVYGEAKTVLVQKKQNITAGVQSLSSKEVRKSAVSSFPSKSEESPSQKIAATLASLHLNPVSLLPFIEIMLGDDMSNWEEISLLDNPKDGVSGVRRDFILTLKQECKKGIPPKMLSLLPNFGYDDMSFTKRMVIRLAAGFISIYCPEIVKVSVYRSSSGEITLRFPDASHSFLRKALALGGLTIGDTSPKEVSYDPSSGRVAVSFCENKDGLFVGDPVILVCSDINDKSKTWGIEHPDITFSL